MNVIPYNKLKYGEDNINLAADGSTYINKAYVGGALSLVRFSEYPKISVSDTAVTFNSSISSVTISVVSNANWTASTESTWLSISSGVSSGNGSFVINVVEAPSQQAPTGTISVVCKNSDATTSVTISVTYDFIRWVYVTSPSFDRTFQITKVRFHMNNVPSSSDYNATEGDFVESPSINTDGLVPYQIDQQTYAYPHYHKFNLLYNSGRYTNDFSHTNTNEYAITSLAQVETGVYELDFGGTVYWGGMQYGSSSFVYTYGNLIEVYGS